MKTVKYIFCNLIHAVYENICKMPPPFDIIINEFIRFVIFVSSILIKVNFSTVSSSATRSNEWPLYVVFKLQFQLILHLRHTYYIDAHTTRVEPDM
jgi:hypothetical protein